jgi:hypothetical protein
VNYLRYVFSLHFVGTLNVSCLPVGKCPEAVTHWDVLKVLQFLELFVVESGQDVRIRLLEVTVCQVTQFRRGMEALLIQASRGAVFSVDVHSGRIWTSVFRTLEKDDVFSLECGL